MRLRWEAFFTFRLLQGSWAVFQILAVYSMSLAIAWRVYFGHGRGLANGDCGVGWEAGPGWPCGAREGVAENGVPQSRPALLSSFPVDFLEKRISILLPVPTSSRFRFRAERTRPLTMWGTSRNTTS